MLLLLSQQWMEALNLRNKIKVVSLDIFEHSNSCLAFQTLCLQVLVLNEESGHWDYGFPGSKLRFRLSMTSWMLLSCLYPFVVRMLRSRRDSLTLAVIFMSLLAMSQRSTDVWVGTGES